MFGLTQAQQDRALLSGVFGLIGGSLLAGPDSTPADVAAAAATPAWITASAFMGANAGAEEFQQSQP